MARNGSGEYSLPANTAAVSGATISSTKFNSIMSDLESTLNTARPVVKGGTGATTAAAARTNLGLAIGTDVQAHDAFLDDIAALTDPGADSVLFWNDTSNAVEFLARSTFLEAANNLSDVTASTARSNLGLGTAAVQADTYFAQVANNLSDLASASTARTNLGLGNMATASYSDTQTFTGIVSVNTSGSNASFSGADELSLRNTSGDVGMTFWSSATGRALVCFADPTGGNVNNRLEVYSDTHASSANDWVFISDGVEFMRWDKSADQVEIASSLDVEDTLTVGGGDALIMRTWDSGDTDIDGLIGGTAFGGLIESRLNGHMTLGIRENDGTDGVYILSGGGNYSTDTTYDTVVASFRAGGNAAIGGGHTPTATLDIDGDLVAKGHRNTSVSGTLNADDHGRGQVNQVSGNIVLPNMENASHGVLINNSGTARTITASGTTMYVNQASVASATLAGRGMVGFVYEGVGVVHLNGAVS